MKTRPKSLSQRKYLCAHSHSYLPSLSATTNLLSSSLKKATDSSVTPYVKSNGHHAVVDPSRLVAPEVKKLANSIRTVEDPVAIKAKSLKVSRFTCSAYLLSPVRKIIPKKLTQNLVPSWVP